MVKKSFIAIGLSLFVIGLLAYAAPQSPAAAAKDDGAGMALIPAGEFWMGRTHTGSLEQAIILERDRRDDQPAHRIHVDAFALDTHEVTNADYARFVEATRAARPWHWPGGTPAKQ